MQKVPHFKSVSFTWLVDGLVHHEFIDWNLNWSERIQRFF